VSQLKSKVARLFVVACVLLIVIWLIFTLFVGFTVRSGEIDQFLATQIKQEEQTEIDEVIINSTHKEGKSLSLLFSYKNGQQEKYGTISLQRSLFFDLYKVNQLDLYDGLQSLEGSGIITDDYIWSYVFVIENETLQFKRSVLKENIKGGMTAFGIIVVAQAGVAIYRKRSSRHGGSE
jgi:hypothetical protein